VVWCQACCCGFQCPTAACSWGLYWLVESKLCKR